MTCWRALLDSGTGPWLPELILWLVNFCTPALLLLLAVVVPNSLLWLTTGRFSSTTVPTQELHRAMEDVPDAELREMQSELQRSVGDRHYQAGYLEATRA